MVAMYNNKKAFWGYKKRLGFRFSFRLLQLRGYNKGTGKKFT